MDFNEWSEQYLKEAQIVRGRVDTLRAELKQVHGKQERDLLYRINILYSMYLELKHTGEFLAKDRRNRNGTKTAELR